MQIVLSADDVKKELMVQFCIAYCGILNRHTLSCTARTGKFISEATGLVTQRFLTAGQGGLEQIAARISCNEIDSVLYFRDPFSKADSAKEQEILRLCDAHNIPLATNIATAEVLIHSLERGDLDWRNLVNPHNQ